MNKLFIATAFLFALGCANNNTAEETHDENDTTETKKLAPIKALKTPFTYSCYGPMTLDLISASEAGFNHKRNEGMPYAGEILFDSKCNEMHYYLFFGVGDIFYPIIDVYEGNRYKDRINIYEDNRGCLSDLGFRQTDITTFQANGKIITINREEVYEVDTLNYNPIDSTRKNIYDTLTIDLKDWCMK